ncbi:hypothetical protein [uncultured Variovorax sp.]|uniref:hypothetical protein n=1 Tax=uncultured Variovorax sp. TaxID=114708 RepID=UPI0025FABC8B|nr:hypothetical protein [uncultured Variovorax sp.]
MKWITAFELGTWATRTTSKALFPGLIADLIRASVDDIGAFRFPSGEKGYVRGFDGVLQTDTGAKPFVPMGHSIWEFGLDVKVSQKADDDYKKRTNEVSAEERKNTTLVLVTAYTWDKPRLKRETWLKKKRDLKEWAAVDLIDGSQLEHWLADHPGVGAWWAREVLALVPRHGARSIDEYWAEFSNRYIPALTEQVLLCARQAQAEKLVNALIAGEAKLRLTADSPDEVIAFAVAAIRNAEAQKRLYLESRTLVVDTSEAVDQLVSMKDLMFLPRGAARNRAGQLATAGPTVISAGADEDRKSFDVLERPSTHALGEALASMFPAQEVAMDRARKCGRSLAILARQIPSSAAENPAWLSNARDLIPALLAGGWDAASEPDKDVLQALGRQKDYDAVEEPFRDLRVSVDPPIDRVDTVWRMRAPVDAFTYLGKRLGQADLNAFAVAAKDVFGRIVEPPKASDRFRLDRKPEEIHSSWLREGLATTLLLIAALGEEVGLVIPNSTPKRFVDGIVSSLPGLGTDWRVVASLRDNLTFLAEGSPDAFLGALEHLLEGGPNKVQPLFAESDDIFAPTSPHVFVLFALEVLAWDPAYLLRVCKVLARLSAFDPGLKMENRPVNTLRSIFLSWAPNTNAPSKQRDGVLTTIIGEFPGLAWELLVKLLPRPYDHSSSNSRPLFREAGGSNVEELTYGIVWSSQDHVVRLALDQVMGDPTRMITLINELGQVQEGSFDSILAATAEFLAAAPAAPRYEVWKALRHEVNRNRTYQSMDWALKGEAIAKLDAVVQRFEPRNPVLLHSNLFDDWMPHIPGVADDDTESIEKARAQAVKEILEYGGVLAIVELAQRAKVPHLIAPALESANLSEADSKTFVLAAVGAGTADLIALASSVSAWMFAKHKTDWNKSLADLAGVNGWSAETLSSMLLQLPDSAESWAVVDSFGEETSKAYWQTKHPFAIKGSGDELTVALMRYLAEGRAMGAMAAGHSRLAEVDSPTLFRMLDEAVAQINMALSASGTMTTYYIEAVFKALEGRSDVSDDEVAQREYAYLPIFDRRKGPLKLHQLIVQRPELFLEFIKLVFKPASGEAPQMDDAKRRHATAAYRLLSGVNIVPGQTGSDVDERAVLQWCLAVQKLAAEADRVRITEQYIGHVLAHAPNDDSDKGWPHRAVRTAIERLASDDVESGIIVERHNMRGVFGKAIGEGGGQERTFAEQAKKWAKIAAGYPRTSAMLFNLANSWEKSAEDEDVRAAKDRLRN